MKRLLIASLLVFPVMLRADPVQVRYSQGTSHAFLSIHDFGGKLLATGDLVQIAHGDRVTSRATFHFRDGSVDDETTIYTQQKTFHLISDHHIQRGPTFPKPMETLVEANGDVTIRDLSKPGEKGTTEHLDLPADTYNGLYFTLIANLTPKDAETRIATVAPVGKGRVVHLSIKPDGEDTYAVGALRRKANIFRMHIELGGIIGVVAPLVGKQPDDVRVWVSSGEAPTVVRIEAQLYEGGPLWRMELVSPEWPKETSEQR